MKHVTYHTETEREAIEYTSKIVDFGLALTISSALNELFTAYTLLRQSKYFKHNVKRHAKEAQKMRDRKAKELSEMVLHKEFSETYWDSAIDASADDVEKLRQAIQTVIEEAKVEDAALYSQVEVTRILLESSVIQFREIINDCTNRFRSKDMVGTKNLNLRAIFMEFDITSIFKEWEAMCDALYGICDAKVDLNDERVSEPFTYLANKFATGQYINDCLRVASEEYPEFANTIIIKEE